MPRTVLLGEPPDVVLDWLERRRALGQDGHDEVWDGEYHVAPMAHSRHGDMDDQLAALLRRRALRAGLRPSGPVNIGVPDDFRVPDRVYFRDRELAVYLPTAAIVVEIVSPGDESYAKLGFYLARGVEEVLIVDPQQRTVEWYARGAAGFERAGRSVLLDVEDAILHGEIDWPPT